jgi:hypothetical protein
MVDNHYSDYFYAIYDEQEPVGHLGRGTHYSVFRCAEFHDVTARRIVRPLTHDFAVIWDEDHDTRIFNVVERMYEMGLLAPVQFIGERKASLHVVVASKFWGVEGGNLATYRNTIQEVIANDVWNDVWNVEVGFYDKVGPHHQTELPFGMIHCGAEQLDTYLRNIDNLWDLGIKPFKIKQPEYNSPSVLGVPTTQTF